MRSVFYININNNFRHLRLETALPVAALNDEKYIDKKGIPHGPGQGEYPSDVCIF